MFEGRSAAEINSKLNWNNGELLDYAATTGGSVRVSITEPSQTILTQHGVAVQLDCASLLKDEHGSVTWGKKNINNGGRIRK